MIYQVFRPSQVGMRSPTAAESSVDFDEGSRSEDGKSPCPDSQGQKKGPGLGRRHRIRRRRRDSDEVEQFK